MLSKAGLRGERRGNWPELGRVQLPGFSDLLAQVRRERRMVTGLTRRLSSCYGSSL